jgi:ribose transport system substrate-binding protein
MRSGRLAVFLTEAQNHYQQLLKSDAAAAAERNGFDLDVTFCSLGVARQIQQLKDAVRQPADSRPRAVIVMPAQDGTLHEEVREAARAGIGWVVLNRRAAFLQGVPEEFPGLPIFAVSPDDVDIGKIQGRQLRELLPRGSRVLLVRGGSGTSTTFEREMGLRAELAGSGIELDVIYGSWTRDGTRKTLDAHFGRVARGRKRPDALACQNDEIAVGALQALDSVATRLARPEWRNVYILGCDGLPDEGQRYVKEGRFKATVLVPSTSGPAIDALARAFERGATPPTEIVLRCAPFPPSAVARG